MLSIKKIICPTDFSEISHMAIQSAGEIAFHFGSELYLLNVVTPIPVLPLAAEPVKLNVASYELEREDSSRKSLEKVIDQFKMRDLKVRLIVLRGTAADEILRMAHEEKADLIVIATRGRTGLDRFLMGSVAEKVIRLADCPVLTVSGRSSEEGRGSG